MQGRSQTTCKQNPTNTIVFHESITTTLKNAPFFEVPKGMDCSGATIMQKVFIIKFRKNTEQGRMK